MRATLSRILGFLLLAGILAACSGGGGGMPEAGKYEDIKKKRFLAKDSSGETTSLLGDPDKKDSQGSGIGVNGFLWRASLDTISFMPLISADPFGGVIITDWYAPPESQDERFKITVYILGRDLRADGVRASVFRQLRVTERGWIDAAVEKRTHIEIEDAILTRARQLRVAGLQ